MTTTTEAPSTNPHQPVAVENRLACAAPECTYSLLTYDLNTPTFKDQPEQAEAFWVNLFKRYHGDQYEPGRAPDIAVDWEISACCSVCDDRIGDVEINDTESVICKDCKTTWSMDGTCGELDDGQ